MGLGKSRVLTHRQIVERATEYRDAICLSETNTCAIFSPLKGPPARKNHEPVAVTTTSTFENPSFFNLHPHHLGGGWRFRPWLRSPPQSCAGCLVFLPEGHLRPFFAHIMLSYNARQHKIWHIRVTSAQYVAFVMPAPFRFQPRYRHQHQPEAC